MIPLDIDWGNYDPQTPEGDWQFKLHTAIKALVNHPRVTNSISTDHTKDTPLRVVKAFAEYFSGLMEDPADMLRKGFERGKYDQMITLVNTRCVSFCAHHLLPILCSVHFGYLPGVDEGSVIVGLSKIPRLIEIYARRPQVQEKMTQEIVECFQSIVQPRGCGVVVDAVHMCVAVRGVRKDGVVTRTTALCGNFLTEFAVKQEFLSNVPRVESFSWI